MRKIIDARGLEDPMAEYEKLIVNDNCSASEGITVWLDEEKAGKKLSLFTSVLGYENRLEFKDHRWVLDVEIGQCVCPV
jgi:hypothetical protein